MAKDAFYFPHDANAQTDPKIIKLLQVHGWEGYGLYWALIEMLRNESTYELEPDYSVYAFALRTKCDLVKSVVEDFKLFKVKGDVFYSESLKRRMEAKDKKSEKARASARARWAKDANAMRTQCDGNAKEEKRREEKRREEKIKLGTFNNVTLTHAELKKLEDKFNGTCQGRIDRLSEYIESSGKKYKSHYATILSWAREDDKEAGAGDKQNLSPAKNIWAKGAK